MENIDKHLLEWTKERIRIEQETIKAIEDANEDFGIEWLEGKVSGLREVYFHILKIIN